MSVLSCVVSPWTHATTNKAKQGPTSGHGIGNKINFRIEYDFYIILVGLVPWIFQFITACLSSNHDHNHKNIYNYYDLTVKIQASPNHS